MTEFDVGAENGVAGRQFDLCLQDGDSIDCDYRGNKSTYPKNFGCFKRATNELY